MHIGQVFLSQLVSPTVIGLTILIRVRGHHTVDHIVIAGLLFIFVPECNFFSFTLFDRVSIIITAIKQLNSFNLRMKLLPFLAGFSLLK